jgi:hypothetical protein
VGDLFRVRREVLERVNGRLKLLVYWKMEMMPKPDEMQGTISNTCLGWHRVAPVGKIVCSRHDIMTRPWHILAFRNVLLPFNFIDDHHQVYSVKMITSKRDRSSLKEFLAVRHFSQISTPLRNSSQNTVNRNHQRRLLKHHRSAFRPRNSINGRVPIILGFSSRTVPGTGIRA